MGGDSVGDGEDEVFVCPNVGGVAALRDGFRGVGLFGVGSAICIWRESSGQQGDQLHGMYRSGLTYRLGEGNNSHYRSCIADT